MTSCEICRADIFPRVRTREMGARCPKHAVACRHPRITPDHDAYRCTRCGTKVYAVKPSMRAEG